MIYDGAFTDITEFLYFIGSVFAPMIAIQAAWQSVKLEVKLRKRLKNERAIYD